MHVTCSACGLNSKIPADEPGGIIRCAGCGKRLRWGESAAAEQAMLPVPDAEDEVGFSYTPRTDEPSAAAYVSKSKKKQVRKAKHNPVLIASVISLVAIMIGVLVLLLTSPSQHTEAINTDQTDRTKLVELKNSADTLALAGKYQDAYQKYNQVIQSAAGSDTKDPVVLEMVAGARTGQDRVMGLMMSIPTTAGPLATAAPNSLLGLPAESNNTPARAATAPPDEPTTAPVVAQATPVLPPTVLINPVPAVALTPQQRLADQAPPIAGAALTRPVLRSYTLSDEVTDKEIGVAIGKGAEYLGRQFQGGIIFGVPDGFVARPPVKPVAPPSEPPTRPPSELDNGSNLKQMPAPPPALPLQGNNNHFVAPNFSSFTRCGFDALAVYALLNAGRAMDTPGLGKDDPFTKNVLEKLKQFDTDATYHRSLRAAALAVFNRTEDNAALEEDLRWLQAASHKGAYTYGTQMRGEGWDNSNSQYGLLGVWSGAQAGKYVPQSYWQDVNSHWTECANPNGTWGYQGGFSFTMTCAGIASMLVTRDYLDSFEASVGGGFVPHESRLADKGLEWLDTGDNCVGQIYDGGLGGAGYALYGLERVGLASGFKYFGDHDWYSELAKHLVHEQHLNGSWYGPGASIEQTAIDTSYSLLFLARGRHPILFNKLRYDGDWNNRASDVAHLARFAANALERPLNWQVVNLRRNWFDWLDAPVLYISGDKPLYLKPADYKSLRQFTEGGGLIFTHADNGSPDFSRWVETLVREIYPKYEMTQVPLTDPIYSTVYPLKNPPRLRSVTNGSRLLLIDSPTDLAGGWQLNWKDARKDEFQLGVNIFVYAAGKQIFKNRLASTYIPPDPDPVAHTSQVTRIQYYSDWDPEPYAWERFARYFQWETHEGLVTTRVKMADLKPGITPMAVVTGTVSYDFLPEEVAAAKAYVDAGGVLFIDSCGGQRAFAKSVETTLLPLAFPGAVPRPIPPNHPLLVASRKYADDLTKPMLRGFANENNGREFPIEALSYGKGWVIFSRLDVTTGLLGTSSWGIFGYDPAYAQAIMKNAVLWAMARNAPPATTSPDSGS